MKLKSIFMFGDPVTITDRVQTGTDAYGDPVFTTTTTTCKGAFSPTDTVENTITGSWQVVDSPNVLLPPTAVVSTSSAVTVRGRTFQVKGTPALWRNPRTGWNAGLKVYLQTTAG